MAPRAGRTFPAGSKRNLFVDINFLHVLKPLCEIGEAVFHDRDTLALGPLVPPLFKLLVGFLLSGHAITTAMANTITMMQAVTSILAITSLKISMTSPT